MAENRVLLTFCYPVESADIGDGQRLSREALRTAPGILSARFDLDS
jgi:hypothetical protein